MYCELDFVSGSHGYLLYIDVRAYREDIIPCRQIKFGSITKNVYGLLLDKEQHEVIPLYDTAMEGTPINVFASDGVSHHGAIISFGFVSYSGVSKGLLLHFLEEKTILPEEHEQQ